MNILLRKQGNVEKILETAGKEFQGIVGSLIDYVRRQNLDEMVEEFFDEFTRAIEDLEEVVSDLEEVDLKVAKFPLTAEAIVNIVYETLEGYIRQKKFFKDCLNVAIGGHYKKFWENPMSFLDWAVYAAIEAALLNDKVGDVVAILRREHDRIVEEIKQQLPPEKGEQASEYISGVLDWGVYWEFFKLPFAMLEERVNASYQTTSLASLAGGYDRPLPEALAIYIINAAYRENPDFAEQPELWQMVYPHLRATLERILREVGVDSVEEQAAGLLPIAMSAIERKASSIDASKLPPILKQSVEILKKVVETLKRAKKLIGEGEFYYAAEETREAHNDIEKVIKVLRKPPFVEFFINQCNSLINTRDEVWSLVRQLENMGFEMEELMDRSEAAEELLRQLRETEIHYEGKKYDVDAILQLAKQELRAAIGGDAVTFVAPTGGTVGKEIAAQGYMDRVLKLIEDWLFGKVGKQGAFAFFLAQAAKDPTSLERWNNLWYFFKSEDFKDKVARLLAVGASAREFKGLLQEVLLAFMEQNREELKVSPQDALAYWKNLNVLAGNLATLAKRITVPTDVEYLVYYISTLDKDFAKLGTDADANPKSCFWAEIGKHSIPSILVATNVAVCYVFFIHSEVRLRELGIEPPTGDYQRVEVSDIWQLGEADGRTLIFVDQEGKITKIRERNTYLSTTYRELANLVWGILNNILQKEFGEARLTPTNWVMGLPAA